MKKSMMMNAVLMAAVLGIAQTASALVYNVNSMATLVGTGVIEGNTPGGEIYKNDFPNTESGAVTSFTTVYSNGNKTATITIDDGIWNLTQLAVKAGPDHTMWILTGWNLLNYTSLVVEQTYLFVGNVNDPNLAEISHVSLYGTLSEDPPSETVPDAGSMLALLGAGMLGLSGLRKRLSV